MAHNNRNQAKQEYAAFFHALQADAKGYPGGGDSKGISALATDVIGMNPKTLAGQLNPTHHDQYPSLPVVLEIINVAQARRAVMAINSMMVGQIPIDFDRLSMNHDNKQLMTIFLSLVQEASNAMSSGSHFAQDGHFDADERRKLEPLLNSLLQTTAELLMALRS